MTKPGKRHSARNDSAEEAVLDRILAPSRQEALLPFYKKDGDARFEDICVEIAQKEEAIEAADKKNAAYRAQYGVDVEGFDQAGAPILVISSKNYQKIDGSNIKEWSGNFLSCWEQHWKHRGVKRFVLAVTVELNSDRLRDAIREEKKRFAALGIGYECWGTRQLTSKLRPYPVLIAAFFNATWAEAVCGTHVLSQVPSAVTVAPAQSLVSVGMEVPPTSVFDALNEATERSLEEAQGGARRGDATNLLALLDDTRRNHVAWEKLDPRVRARFLRSDALRKVDRGDLQETRNLLDAADMLAPPADRTARALVLYRIEGVAPALAYLTNPSGGKECHLRAALLMEEGSLTDASELLSRPQASEPAEERLRLSAILAAYQGDLSLVRSRLEELSRVARQDFASDLVLIALRFFLSLAPGSPLQLTAFPNPIPLTLARQDDEARSLREQAIALCDAIAAGCDDEHRSALEVWKLACLLVDEVHYARGLQFASDLVRRTKPHAGAVAWALACGAQFDLKQLRTTLEARVVLDRQARDVAALALITRLRRGAKAALHVIQTHGQGFRRADDIALMAMWRRGLSEQETDSQTRFPRLVRAARRSKSNTALVNYLVAPGVPALELAAGAEFLARSSRPADLNFLRQSLVALGTSSALELAIEGAREGGDHAATPQLISLYQQAIGSRMMPYRIRLIAAEAGWRRGDVPSALHMLEVDGFDREAADAAVQRARLFARVGNVEGAARVLRIHRERGGIDASQTLDLAYHVRATDSALAREIVEQVGARPLEGAALGMIYRLADELGLTGLQERLTPAFQERVARGEVPNVVLLTAEQREALVRHWQQQSVERVQRWLQGELPLHAAFDQDAQGLLSIFFGAEGSGRTLPMLLRGAREKAEAEIGDLSSLKLRVDVTALLVAARFDLLDLLDEAGEVSIPIETGAAILELEHSARAQPQLRHAVSVLKELRQRVVSNLETSRWKGLPPLQHRSERRSATATGSFVRTLLDVLGNPVAEGTVCWLEDRHCSLFASIAGAPRMDALSVFRWLSKGDAGSAARADQLRRALAAAGYAFGLWPIDDIAAVIKAANLPATGQALPRDLLEVRDYFTLEVSLLRHLNRTVIDAEIPGMPVEMRYAGRSLHLAPRLMAQIWSEGEAADATWRSRWCWRNLRREQVEHLPASHQDTETRRNLRFLSLVELAMSVAIGDWGPAPPLNNEKRRDFLAWALGDVIEPVITVEPEFETRLIDQLSSSFKEFLEGSELELDQRRALADYIDSLISCFPERWAKRIRRTNGLETALGQRTEDVVTVGGDVVFRVQDFATGVAEALADGAATVARVQSKDSAQLLHVPSQDPPQVVVEVSGRRLQLSDASFGLLSPNEATRRAAAARLVRQLDCPAGEQAAFAELLRRAQEPAEVIACVAEARNNSYLEQLRRLQGALQQSEEIDYALLTPPAPEIIAHFLRLKTDDADPSEWKRACEGLADEIGVLPAAKRVAATTLGLSPAFKERFGKAIVEECQEEGAPAQPRAPTPLYALLFAQALMAANAPQELVAKAISDLAHTCKEDGPAFCSVLKWSRRITANHHVWKGIDASQRELLLMVHADMVLGTLVIGGAEPARLVEVFDASDEPQLQAQLDRSAGHKHPFERSRRLTGHIVAALLKGADAQTVRLVVETDLRDGIALHSDGRWAAHPTILELATPWHTWSWANRDPAAELAAKGVLELVPPFDLRDSHALIQRILELTEEEGAAARFQYLALLDLREVSGADLQSIASAMEREKIDEITDPFSPLFHVCGRVMMNVLGALGCKEQAVALTEKWAALAARQFGDDFAEATPRSGSQDRRWPAASQLFDICLGYVFGTRQASEDTFAAFAECLEAIARVWPAAADACTDLLVQAADQIDVVRARPLWFSVQRIRLRIAGTR